MVEGSIDGSQIESHYTYINSGAAAREAYSRKLASSILNFVGNYYAKYSKVKILSRIQVGANDAEEYLGGKPGVLNISSYSLELGTEKYSQMVGLRFSKLYLPANAVIESAYIQFTTSFTSSSSAGFTLRIENKINPAPYSTTISNISLRDYSVVQIPWSPAAWNSSGQAGTAQRSPELKLLLQDVLSRQANKTMTIDSLAFAITGYGKRVAYSAEGYPSRAPQLIIIYSISPTSRKGD